MLRKILPIFGASICTGSAAVWYFRKRENVHANYFDYRPTAEWDFNWDKRDPASRFNPAKKDVNEEEEISKYTPKVKRHILFIRHGQYNLDGERDADRKLTALGKEQARLTGELLKNHKIKVSRIVQSSMTRAKETCEVIKPYLPEIEVETFDILREGAPCPPIPKKRSWEPELKYFADSLRIESAFRQFLHRADHSDTEESYEVVVAHANVIRYFVCRALQFPPEGWLRISLAHGSITHITVFTDGSVVLNSMGDAGHIPAEKLTRYN